MPLFVRILFVVALFTITLLIILPYTFRVVVSKFGALVGIIGTKKKTYRLRYACVGGIRKN